MAALLFTFCFQAYAEEPTKEEKEAMEVGGLMTVDMGGPVDTWDNLPAELGTVELSALVHVSDEIHGSITLLSENDPENISIDQALGSWIHGNTTLVFGKQLFNLGLLTTRYSVTPPSLTR